MPPLMRFIAAEQAAGMPDAVAILAKWRLARAGDDMHVDTKITQPARQEARPTRNPGIVLRRKPLRDQYDPQAFAGPCQQERFRRRVYPHITARFARSERLIAPAQPVLTALLHIESELDTVLLRDVAMVRKPGVCPEQFAAIGGNVERGSQRKRSYSSPGNARCKKQRLDREREQRVLRWCEQRPPG